MRHRQINWLNFFLAILILLLLSWNIYQVIVSDVFTVQKIYINSDPKFFSDMSSLKIKRHLLWFNTTDLSQQIQLHNPWIKQVVISKKLPNQLWLYIMPRQPVVEAKSPDRLFYFDNQGKLLPDLKLNHSKLPQLKCSQIELNDQNFITDPILVKSIQVVDALNHNWERIVKSLSCGDQQFRISLDKTDIILSNQKPVDQTVTSLLFLFKQFRIEGKYPHLIDLSFDKPVLTMEESPAKSVGNASDTGQVY